VNCPVTPRTDILRELTRTLSTFTLNCVSRGHGTETGTVLGSLTNDSQPEAEVQPQPPEPGTNMSSGSSGTGIPTPTTNSGITGTDTVIPATPTDSVHSCEPVDFSPLRAA